MSLTMIVVTGIAVIALAALLIYLILTMRALSDVVTEELKEGHRSVMQTLDNHLGDHGTRLEDLLWKFEKLLRSKRVEGLATVGDLRDEARNDRKTWQAAILDLRKEARDLRKEARDDRQHFQHEIKHEITRLTAELAKKEESR